MPLCYSQLTLVDRRRPFNLRERKVSVSEIARQLGRHRSTIYRELKRNTFHDREFPEYSGYYSGIANDMSKERRRRMCKLRRHPQLRALVIERLKARWSPEQIAGRLSLTASAPSGSARRRSIASSTARRIMRWSSIGICRKAVAGADDAVPASHEYRNALILLTIARSSGIGRGTS